MNLRQLNEKGIAALETFLDGLRNGISVPRPDPFDPELSEKISDTRVNLGPLPSSSRLEAARFLLNITDSVPELHLERNRGFWAWISLYYFDCLCPASSAGRHSPGETARWIPDNNNFRKYYRHLLLGPWRLYSLYRDEPEIIAPLLSNPLHKPGEFYEQIVSRQELITNPSILRVIRKIYWDSGTGKPKKGAASKSKGSIRRLADVVQQFSRTYDLFDMPTEAIIGLLPAEFKAFRLRD
ncbi:hypothetical protein D6779_04290 [Candidatus Parcubacteria bacterium]|nr:MAG: hypothetical protein D6779_04290 [Candidatus Parcubacteria bacterium]